MDQRIDKDKLIAMFKLIHREESRNVRTKKLDDNTMVRVIMRMIRDGANDKTGGNEK